MVTSIIVLLSIIIPSRHTGVGAWVNSKMYISLLYNIINCHARVFYEKNRTNLDLHSASTVMYGIFYILYFLGLLPRACGLKKIRTRLDLLSIPQSRGKNVKTFRWDHRLQIRNLFMAFKRVPPVVVTLGQQYNIGEKPTVILYTYINRHARTPEKQHKKTK